MTVYIVDLEAVDTRYTAEWKKYLPDQLQQALVSDVVVLDTVEVISGGDVPQATTPGAFLNFGGTNIYKSNQLQQIGELFCNGKINNGDYFLYTDAWNPTVIQLRYMAELLGIDIKIGGMWHAGSYDPQDFLGRLIGSKPWVRYAEASMFECYDHNFFATQFHIDLFCKTFGGSGSDFTEKFVRTGWPMEYAGSDLLLYKNMEKKDIILFPHRVASEKQPEIFRDLAESLPEYEFIICQEQGYTKNEYHNALGEAKLVFSANLQETLGISWYEGALVDAIPMVPDRLSYSEMALDVFSYASEWTETFDKYMEHKELIIYQIKDYMDNYDKYIPKIRQQVAMLEKDFFHGNILYNTIRESR